MHEIELTDEMIDLHLKLGNAKILNFLINKSILCEESKEELREKVMQRKIKEF